MKFLAQLSSLSSLALLGTILVGGCSSASDAGGNGEGALTPTAASNEFDQAKVCDGLFTDRAAFRDPDLQQGVPRWKCEDVAGVTGHDLGQEYCEYHAVSAGTIVDTQASAAVADGTLVSCVFNSVYQDADASIAAAVGDALIDPRVGNLVSAPAGGAAPANAPTSLDKSLTQMQVSFNSRGAATALIVDCAQEGQEGPTAHAAIVASRAAACYQASQAITDPKAQASLAAACRAATVMNSRGLTSASSDLGSDDVWGKVSAQAQAAGSPINVVATSDSTDAGQRQLDIAACVRTTEGTGIAWRNSDPTICTRSIRVAGECSDKLGNVPDALPGFLMTGWANGALPAGCRHGKVWKDASGNLVDGSQVQQAAIDSMSVSAQDFAQVVICDADPADVQASDGTLQQYCEQKFAGNIAMTAPIGALVAPPHSTVATPFCSEFNAGVDVIQAPAAGQ